MNQLETSELHWDKKSKTFSVEISELVSKSFTPSTKSIKVTNILFFVLIVSCIVIGMM